MNFIKKRSKQALSNIYLTFIRPVLEYACEVWDGCYERDIEKLEKIQLGAARIVTGLTKFASKDSLYFETGWETLANRRETRKLTTFYKIHNNLCPPYLFNCLPPVTSDVNSYNLRNNQNYVPPRCRLRTSELAKVSHPVSKYNESLLANFVRPVTIRAASNCIFSNFSMSRS
jgi:hypothetical protein